MNLIPYVEIIIQNTVISSVDFGRSLSGRYVSKTFWTRTLVHAFVSNRLDNSTAYWLVSAANCYKGSKSSRTLPLVLSQEPEDQSIWRPSYAIFTGSRFDGGSRSRQQFWSTSVCTTWLHSTFRHFRHTVSRRQQLPPGVFDPLTPADWLFHAPEQTTANLQLSSDFALYKCS